MLVKVLVENTSNDIFQGEHGLSLFIEYKGKNYLIDTGATGLYWENARKMGVDLATVDKAFLSHAHYDHSGGYREFFEVNKEAKVYLQKAAARRCCFKLGPVKKYIGIPKGVLEEYKDRFEYVDGYKDFGNGIYILPHTTEGLEERGKHAHMACEIDGNIVTDDFSHEQTLVFEEENGLVLFNSCSHGGVENIIDEVKAVFPDKKIKAFFGGFHMMGAMGPSTCSFKREEVDQVATKLMSSSEATFYSGHCTGEIAFAWLKEGLGSRLVAFQSGKIFEI